jgi:hypothetical protein
MGAELFHANGKTVIVAFRDFTPARKKYKRNTKENKTSKTKKDNASVQPSGISSSTLEREKRGKKKKKNSGVAEYRNAL